MGKKRLVKNEPWVLDAAVAVRMMIGTRSQLGNSERVADGAEELEAEVCAVVKT